MKKSLAGNQKTDRQKPVTVALAGNPNVGKSTVFNALTGLHQHTGNWPGKTVDSARGSYTYKGRSYDLVDIPGTYSLSPHSAEEEIARDFICFGGADVTVIVCDATCLARNLNLVLQTLEITGKAVLCLNLMDEAKRKNICVDVKILSASLGIPVVPMCARSGKGFSRLMEQIRLTAEKSALPPLSIPYRDTLEDAISMLLPHLSSCAPDISPRFLAVSLLCGETFASCLPLLTDHRALTAAIDDAQALLSQKGLSKLALQDAVVSDIYALADSIYRRSVSYEQNKANNRHTKIDRLLTGRLTGIPVMLLLLLFVLWLTTVGANYPSALLSDLFAKAEPLLSAGLKNIGTPLWLHDILVLGIFRILSWVVSVMLPPMAIFFPLFTLLEDLGYLPRIAFNLDSCFKRCNACGKQALTMCMGFGCNAVGVTGSRIIDSPRERMLAILTNCFVPCNGRFPTLIALISMFFLAGSGFFASLGSAALLTGLIVLAVGITFLASRFLSATFLKGVPSSFVLELPPYRKPQVGKVIVRSVFDRTLFVLGRAVLVAAPAGLLIYLMANLHVGGGTLLSHAAAFFDPFARLFGLDGVIFLAFILGFPANEIVLPIAVMTYLSAGSVSEIPDLVTLKTLLIQNGWTPVTALCTMVFSLMHWPCGTTLLSIKKETGNWRWTLLGFLLPTAIGLVLCFVIASVSHLFGI